MKATIISIILAVVFIGGAVMLSRGGVDSAPTRDNVSIVDGKQVIAIEARGGYLPKNSVAQANMPTVLKVSTRGTFDCSAAISIPALGYRKNLAASAETFIDVPPQAPGTTLRGLCAMGMYNFTVQFN